MKFHDLGCPRRRRPGSVRLAVYRDAAVVLNCEWSLPSLPAPTYFWRQLHRMHAPAEELRNALRRLYQ